MEAELVARGQGHELLGGNEALTLLLVDHHLHVVQEQGSAERGIGERLHLQHLTAVELGNVAGARGWV